MTLRASGTNVDGNKWKFALTFPWYELPQNLTLYFRFKKVAQNFTGEQLIQAFENEPFTTITRHKVLDTNGEV